MRVNPSFYCGTWKVVRKAATNRHVLLWPMAIALLVTTGCPPRHPPHTPQPFGTANLGDGLTNVAGPLPRLGSRDLFMRAMVSSLLGYGMRQELGSIDRRGGVSS